VTKNLLRKRKKKLQLPLRLKVKHQKRRNQRLLDLVQRVHRVLIHHQPLLLVLLLHQKLPPFSNLKMKEIAKQLSM
jgi:hypothetical protein